MARMNFPRASRSTITLLLANQILTVLCLISLPAHAQAPVSLNSHEVHPDGRITFRYKDSKPTKVLLDLDGAAPLPMKKDNDGVWSVVTPPLTPEIYGYAFEVDGQPRLDPLNTIVKPNLVYIGNSVTVPGKTPQLWDALDVPHGEVHHHFYTSKVALNLPARQSDYFVYTPPGYDPSNLMPYPVLYLLH